jgi:hypothetical protein
VRTCPGSSVISWQSFSYLSVNESLH